MSLLSVSAGNNDSLYTLILMTRAFNYLPFLLFSTLFIKARGKTSVNK